MATTASLGPGDVENALAAYGPLTDVWQVEAVHSGTVTVQLAKTSGAVPYVAPSLVPHYEGALVRFTTGPLSGGGDTAQWNTTVRNVQSTASGTTVTFGDPWPTTPQAGDQFTVIRGAGIGTNLSLKSGTAVTATFSGPVSLASGATVALEAGSTVDVGTISGPVTIASGSTIEITGSPTVDVTGQSIVVESANTDAIGSSDDPFPPTVTAVDVGFYTVSGQAGAFQWHSVLVPEGTSPQPPLGLPVAVVGPWESPGGTVTPLQVSVTNTVTVAPAISRSASVNVQSVAAGSTANFDLQSNVIYHLSVAAGGEGGGYINVELSSGPWLAACGVPGNAQVAWPNSGYATDGATISVYNAGSAAAQVMVAIEYT